MDAYRKALEEAKDNAPDSSAEATLQGLIDATGVGEAHTQDGGDGPPPKKPPVPGGNG